MIIDYKTSIYKKHLVRVINKDYDHSIKESSLSPPGGIHTRVSSSIHLSPATGENKTLSTQLYSARLIRQEKRK